MSEVRILHGSLDDEDGEIIIRGLLDQSTLKYINIGWYQREQGFSPSHTQDIVDAFFAGTKVPDITIGMRGQRVSTSRSNSTYVLRDKCFCIDGGQRLYGAGVAVSQQPDLKISLGAKVFLGTNEDIENDMFCKLGTTQKRVAPSVLLRNRKKKSQGARVLVEMNSYTGFALKDRITWGQTRTRHELISGYSFARVVGGLHGHLAPLRASKIYELLGGLDRLYILIGEEALKGNIVRFFDTIDTCWTIRNQTGGRGARPHLKPAFLQTLARLMSNYPEFWDGKERHEFYFPSSYIKRLKGFKLSDFAKASNANMITNEVLYEMLRKQLRLNPTSETSEAAE